MSRKIVLTESKLKRLILQVIKESRFDAQGDQMLDKHGTLPVKGAKIDCHCELYDNILNVYLIHKEKSKETEIYRASFDVGDDYIVEDKHNMQVHVDFSNMELDNVTLINERGQEVYNGKIEHLVDNREMCDSCEECSMQIARRLFRYC